MTQLTIPKMAEVLPGTNLQDGRVRYFATFRTEPKPLGAVLTLQGPKDIAPGGRKQTLPAGTRIRMCGREALTELSDDLDHIGMGQTMDTRVVVVGWRVLWEVLGAAESIGE